MFLNEKIKDSGASVVLSGLLLILISLKFLIFFIIFSLFLCCTLNSFLNYVRQQDEAIKIDSALSDKKYLKTMLKSEIAGAKWGINELWGVRVKSDNQLMESLKHFDKADSFLKSYSYN